jgi:hypothetical protein
VFELQLGVFVLFLSFVLLFLKALKSSPHVELQYFGFSWILKNFQPFLFFIYSKGLDHDSHIIAKFQIQIILHGSRF